MNEEQYQGLNLPQLLDLMHDIVAPAAISMQPQTPGWWVLLFWLLAALTLAVVRWMQIRRKNLYRREAMAMIEQVDTSAPGAGAEIARVVKRTALVVYPRDLVAALCGSDWAAFLAETSNGDATVVGSADRIAAAAYRSDINASDLVEPAVRWIKVHRA